MKDGLFLLRGSKDSRDCVLSLVHRGGFQHYKVQALAGESVQLLDPSNGNRQFPDILELVRFYKVYNPNALGGLACRLASCIQSRDEEDL